MFSSIYYPCFVDLVKKILSKLEKPYSGSSQARIAVEVGEEEDIRLLVQAEREDKKYNNQRFGLIRVDWNKTAEDEESAIYSAMKNIKLLLKSWVTFSRENTAEDEDPAILWALKNEKFGIVDILMAVNQINLQGDPSADLTINCGAETFRVHKYFFCSKSQAFNDIFNIPSLSPNDISDEQININTMNSNTLSSMIHYIYTGELSDGWQDLDIQVSQGC